MRLFTVMACCSILATGCTIPSKTIKVPIDNVVKIAELQTKAMALHLADNAELLPRSYDKNKDEIITSGSKWWCSGFFSGTNWYLYECAPNEVTKKRAIDYMLRVEKEKYNTYDHDIGFQMFTSYGNAYRLTRDTSFQAVLLTAAQSATKRFNPHIGLIRSWDFHRKSWQYPVIIDNLMNLELLMWAFHQTNDSTYYRIAVSHADKTLENHFRKDYSCYHLVSYDTISARPHVKATVQGASDESMWARGHAWALYGYTMMYRETGLVRYLEQAQGIANLLITHKNMPADYVPYWDFMAPNIPNEPRDASAAAVIASALIELSSFVDADKGNEYFRVAEKQLQSLSSEQYLATEGSNGFFILKHSVGSLPHNSEVDVPLTYADYYFMEALVRYKKQLERKVS